MTLMGFCLAAPLDLLMLWGAAVLALKASPATTNLDHNSWNDQFVPT